MSRLRGRLAKLEAELEFSATRVSAASRQIDWLADSFPNQRDFVESGAPLSWALCTRRAAKTFSAGLKLMRSAYEHEGACLYLGLTREAARRNLWDDVLKVIDRKHGVGFQFHDSRLVARSPRGTPIYLAGADSNEDEMRKVLGNKYRVVIIDESQAWRVNLRNLVYGVLKPAVADYRGSIAAIGTPGNLVKGFFYELTKGTRAGSLSAPSVREPGWEGHSWTTFANPHMARQWADEIESLKRDNPRVVETSWFRQNYLGEWVIEADALVYRFNAERNLFSGRLPKHKYGAWHFVLGVDLGWDDSSAFVVLAYHDYDKQLFIIKAEKDSKLDITAVAQRIRVLMLWLNEEYGAEFDTTVIDGANKQAVEEMRKRHKLPLRAADKRDKFEHIDIMNSDFIIGKIKLESASTKQLQEEYAALVVDERSLEKSKRVEHPGCENHLADAALYGYRHCLQYLAEKPPQDKPEEDKIEEFLEERLAVEQAERSNREWHLR